MKFGRHELIFTLLLVAATAIVLNTNQYIIYVLTLVAMFSILTVSFDILLGYTGYISLAHGALFGCGAYAIANLTVRFGWSFWTALPVAGLITAAIGLVVALISFRTKGLYFAVLTLGLGLVGQQAFLLAEPVTGGIMGFSGMMAPAIGALPEHQVMLIIAVSVLWLTYLCARLFVASRLGAASLAVREDITLAQALGVRVGVARLAAFIFSAFFAGVAGGIYACLFGYISPEAFGVMNLGFHSVVQIVVGGMGTLWGPIIGTLLMVSLPESVRGASAYALLFYGIVMLVVIRFAPEGIAGLIRSLRGMLAAPKQPAETREAGR